MPQPGQAGSTPENQEIRERVARLEARVTGTSSADEEWVIDCTRELNAMRELWRGQPNGFSEQDIAILRNVAAALKNAQRRAERVDVVAVNGTSPSIVSSATSMSDRATSAAHPIDPDSVLRSIFGYSAFRPGQRHAGACRSRRGRDHANGRW
jgi:cell division septum initiation protein DivIVA